MENTEKVQNYKGGEIRRTVDGYYIFVKGDAHSGPYVSISAAKGTADTTEAEAETLAVESADEVVEPEVKNINDNAESETADTTEAEAETLAVESADEVVEPEVKNINDNAESETADTTEAEAESTDEK